MTQQWIHLVVFLIIVGGGVIRVVVNKLQEQANKRRLEMEAERRRLEALRTGRDVPSLAPPRPTAPNPLSLDPRSAQRDLEELARRRAAQLQELRRLQQERQQGSVRQTATRVEPQALPRFPGSSGPIVPGARPPVRPPVPFRKPAPVRASTPARAPVRPPARPPQQRRPAPSPPPPPPSARRPATPAPSVVPAGPISAEAIVPHHTRVWGAHANDWRHAIMMSEVLSPPLALRTGEPGPLARRF